ncbi:MAG: prolipoprotein diacylglyceryl transferase [Sphingomonadaceae bacterium]
MLLALCLRRARHYEGAKPVGKALTALDTASLAAGAIRWSELGLDPVAVDLGVFVLRWYALAYIAGIVIGWWYLMKLIDRPGAPMARRHADDLATFVTIGVLLGGRLGYVFFYRPEYYLANPLEIIRIWDGGMSFHGGVIGVSLAMVHVARKEGLDWLRIHDYVACCVPFGLFFGRLANFVNAELWGRPTDLPWAVIFPAGGEVPRHPSQLYEAALEGLALFVLLWFLFWRTRARYHPGKLTGAFLLGYGASRFVVEFFRAPDEHLTGLALESGLSMGQWLTLPMIMVGAYLVATAASREHRLQTHRGHAAG